MSKSSDWLKKPAATSSLLSHGQPHVDTSTWWSGWLQNGADVNKKTNGLGWTPLVHACAYRQYSFKVRHWMDGSSFCMQRRGMLSAH